MKVSALNNVVLAGDFLAIITFDKMEFDDFEKLSFFCTRDTTYYLGSNFLCFHPDCSTQHKGSLECLSVSLSFSRRDDEQRSLSSLSIDRRCPRHVGVPSGTFAALAKPGERGLTAP